MVVLTGTASFVLGATLPNIVSNLISAFTAACKTIYTKYEVSTYQGYKKPTEAIKSLKSNFESEVFGQEKAKIEITELLSGFVSSEKSGGNVICLTGHNGTGKTVTISAITHAMLKYPDKATFVCSSERINSESDLASQLFGTVPLKDVSSPWGQKTVLGMVPTLPKEEKSNLLYHLENWQESIVVLKNYNKVKLKSKNAAAEKSDKSADEILSSIALTGKYRFMNREIDCSKILFLVTVDETKDKFEKTFRTNTDAQKLNIVDFDYLDIEACKKIVKSMIIKTTEVLTSKNGVFKIKEVEFIEGIAMNWYVQIRFPRIAFFDSGIDILALWSFFDLKATSF